MGTVKIAIDRDTQPWYNGGLARTPTHGADNQMTNSAYCRHGFAREAFCYERPDKTCPLDSHPTTEEIALTPSERHLLVWLSYEETSQYGECYGGAFDSLMGRGLVRIHDIESEVYNNFIAKRATRSPDIMYRAVSLTEAGVQLADQYKEQSDDC